MQWVFRHDPIYIYGQRRAQAILLCNREAIEAVPPRLKAKVQWFPVNGISAEDLEVFARNDLRRGGAGHEGKATDLPARSFHVISAGKLLGLKGFPMAIRAFALFAKDHADVEFTIVGDGPERAPLESLVRNLGLERQVYLEKWMPRRELLGLMSQCDTFLFPSLRDGGGAVVVEAMAAGIPVICMDLAGPGINVTEECGIKIPPQGPEQTVSGIVEALDRLYGDRGLRTRMGRAARRRVEEAYAWDKLGDRLRGIYESMVGVRNHNSGAEIEGTAKAPRDGQQVG
jgi:glycosyltransferase involved in cell wall biosynthesis